MTLREKLLAASDAYCQATSLSVSRLSTIMLGGGHRLSGVAAGKDINTKTYESAMQWLSDNWPDDAGWPEGVERPAPTSADGEAA